MLVHARPTSAAGQRHHARQVLSTGMELPVDGCSKDIANDLAAKVKQMQVTVARRPRAQSVCATRRRPLRSEPIARPPSVPKSKRLSCRG